VRLALHLAAVAHDRAFIHAARRLRCRPADMVLAVEVGRLHRQVGELLGLLGEQPGEDVAGRSMWRRS
jgi:hypothetical protein